MSVIFVPPPQRKDLKLRDLFDQDGENSRYWQSVRRAQIESLDRFLNLNLIVAAVCGLIIFAVFHRAIPNALTAYIVLSHAVGFLSALKLRCYYRRTQVVSVTAAELRQIAVMIGAISSGWGAVVFYMFSLPEPVLGMLSIGLSMAAITALAFTTSNWPLGALISWPFLALGAIFSLFYHEWPNAAFVATAIVALSLFTMRATFVSTRHLMLTLHLQERMDEQEEVVRLLLNEFEVNGSEWLFEFNSDGRLVFASSRFGEALRRPIEEVLGQHWSDFLSKQGNNEELVRIIDMDLPFRDLLVRVDVEGEVRWWTLSGTPKLDRFGKAHGYRGVGCDITDRQRAAERIAELATFDPLTGLVNRRIIHQNLNECLAAAEQQKDSASFALLFVDLDRYKGVNDSMGHAVGDHLLAEVGCRLRELVRKKGDNHALVGRLGGDEFAILMRNTSQAQAHEFGRSVIARISEPYYISSKQVTVGASIGLAMGPRDGKTVESLMRAADMALYDVKARGRGTVKAYDGELYRAAESRRILEMDLRNAADAGQLWLAYQPSVDAKHEIIMGFEALLRWRHPEQGNIPPSDFIPIAEETGLIGQIGKWVLERACTAAVAWPQHVKVAVNVSPLQFDDPDLVKHVQTALDKSGLAPHRLELELTESLFLSERPQTMQILAALRDIGVGIALDDFGTGYSSLGYLQKIRFNRIKIDRCFVQACAHDGAEATAIIQTIIALAKSLQMSTTAEGTETRYEFEVMRDMGCDHVQGYYFGKPMPEEEIGLFLSNESFGANI